MIEKNNISNTLRGLVLIVVAGAWMAGILLDSFLPLSSPILLLAAGLALIFLFLVRQDGKRRLMMLLLLCLLLGAWRYTIALPANDPQTISAFIGNTLWRVRGTVSDEPKLQGRTRLLIVTVDHVGQDAVTNWQEVHGQLEVQVLGTSIEEPYGANYGSGVELRGKLQPTPPHSPPGIVASMAFPRVNVNSTGSNPILAWLYHLRVTLATLLSQSLPQPEAALLIAILLGLRTPALKPLTLAFNVTGTAHLIVPSGFKVTILAGLAMSSTKWLREGYPQTKTHARVNSVTRTPRGWRCNLATALVLGSIAIYTILSGAGCHTCRSHGSTACHRATLTAYV